MESLYELTGDYKRLEELEEELDPEVFQDTLDSIEDAIENKAQGYAAVIKQFKADVKMLRDEEKRLAERRQSIETKIGIMQTNLYDAMKQTGVDKIKSPRFTIWIQKSPVSVNVTNEKLIPTGFFVPQPAKLDKKQLAEELKHGDVAGAELVQSEGVRIK